MLATGLSVVLVQGKLEDALWACENKCVFALEQLERAAHEAAEVGVVKWRELYTLGMQKHLVRFSFALLYACTYTRASFYTQLPLRIPTLTFAHTYNCATCTPSHVHRRGSNTR